MAMLSRYQKSGGFLQILKLIETCGKQKQENFLNMIHLEDPRWAETIKLKMLTIDRIFAWPEDVLAEVCGRLQPITLATIRHGLDDEKWEKLVRTLSHSQKRAIDDLANSKKSDSPEISAAFIKVIEEVRTLIKDGYLRVEKFAPELHIEDGIEEKIGKSMGVVQSGSPSPAAEVPNMDFPSMHSDGAVTADDPNVVAELKSLRSKVLQVTNEVNGLKTENKVLKERLTQIKKLAA